MADVKLTALSPLDGRYSDKVNELREFFSEEALIKERIRIEVKYLQFVVSLIRSDINFGEHDLVIEPDCCNKVKDIESKTNHDVKAVEYYLQENLSKTAKHKELLPYIHIGLTSEDVNSLSRSLLIKSGTNVMLAKLWEIYDVIKNLSTSWDIPMLARTHGQPATPTNLGKEFKVYNCRIMNQIKSYSDIKHRTKFGGATGGFNAMVFAFPEIDWETQLDKFVNSFGLERHKFTTQIDHFDNYSEIFDWLKRINTILIDLCQDVWFYCSMDYFKLKIDKNEVGSSTMPHKVNPIDFENAEANLKLSNVLLSFFSDKLPVSRLQRDLTDSTISRNIGVGYGHSFLAMINLIKGLKKLSPNEVKISDDLNSNYSILGEAIQTILRKRGVANAYEIIKNLTRDGSNMNKERYKTIIKSLYDQGKITEGDMVILIELTPEGYARCYI